MNIRHQLYMIAIAEEGSLNRAARRLGVTQPALSNWLHSLEEELGTPLVIRTRRQLVLTPAGQIYLNGCRRIVHIRNQAFQVIHAPDNHAHKPIIIGGSPIRGARAFACIFADFHKAYPEINLDFHSGRNSELKQNLMDETITMSFFGATDTRLEDLDFIKIANEELVLMLPPGHPLSYDTSGMEREARLPVLQLDRLKDTPLLISKSETSHYSTVMHLLRDANLETNIIFRSNIIPLLYDMVLNGCGASLIPRAYFSPGSPVCAYSLYPGLIAYQGIALKMGHRITEPERFLIHLTMKHWGAPVYLREYAAYYMEQNMEQEEPAAWT